MLKVDCGCKNRISTLNNQQSTINTHSSNCPLTSPMAPLLIIGIGNTLRSDDGLGVYAAEELEKRLDPAEVEVLQVHQLMPELAHELQNRRAVLFLDAAARGPAGQITSSTVEPDNSTWGAWVHQLAPATLMTAAATLYGATPPATLLSVAGEDFSMSEQLSPIMAQTLPLLVERACQWAQEQLASR